MEATATTTTNNTNTMSLDTLSQWFLQSLSPDPAPRRHAESSLSAAADQPGFARTLLRLASSPSADPSVRHASAVHFKNHLRSRWPPSSPSPLPLPERDPIKSELVPLLLSSPPPVQSQLSESLSLISSHDFPRLWPSLLPFLVSSLRSFPPPSPSLLPLLSVANSVFKRFRSSFDTTDTRLDLKHCLDHFASPLLDTFLLSAQSLSSSLSSPHDLSTILTLLESLRLCCRIFLSLNSIELPEFFEDHMREWMSHFRSYLTLSFPPQIESSGKPDDLRSAICENLQLYMEKNEEEFAEYLEGFASAVWTLLMSPSPSSPSRDRLTITAIHFLTTVSTSVHHKLFGSPEVLHKICRSVVFPNAIASDEDEELFEMNHVEFIRRDIEGSDADTRRRVACELLKGLAVHYREQVMSIVSAQVQAMLSRYAANPTENWKDKDCAMYLVVALATRKPGGTIDAAYIVDVEGFFASAVVPELRGEDVNATPMVKAGALKFFTAFRNQIPKPTAAQLLPDVIRFLTAESNVVHSYAANCIEKLLLVKDAGGVLRYGPADILPFVQPLMTNLYNALQFPESKENPYVMKCFMRVFGVAEIGPDIATFCVTQLSLALGEVCKNPKDPIFNHYLFEAIAALVGRSCERNPSLVKEFETRLFPVLQTILVNDITEFWPYAFQIFSQLVAINQPPLSESYMQLFNLLLSPETWKRPANVPALTQLLQAYLRKIPHELNSQGRLTQVLEIFNQLILLSSTEDLGFYILNTVLENLGIDVVAPYFPRIWSALFYRLQKKETPKFVKSLVISMSLVAVKHGPMVLVNSVNAVQENIFIVILEKFWVPRLKQITGFMEVKLSSVASTRLICETPLFLNDSAIELWGKMLDSIVSLLAKPDQEKVIEETDMPEIGETMGYSASFVRLHNVGGKEDDPLKEIKDPKAFLVTSLARVSMAAPGKYPHLIERFLESANKEVLRELCKSCNCDIVNMVAGAKQRVRRGRIELVACYKGGVKESSTWAAMCLGHTFGLRLFGVVECGILCHLSSRVEFHHSPFPSAFEVWLCTSHLKLTRTKYAGFGVAYMLRNGYMVFCCMCYLLVNPHSICLSIAGNLCLIISEKMIFSVGIVSGC